MSNHLKDQTSPYLLEHAENPVDWYPWGEKAFEKARSENKPVFLSIGYSTCHWCHVMAKESFEDCEIAGILNEHYVCIKVDREERPDIDSVYMSVCQAMTGSGGWPTSIFMTAERMPFFAGTYFPKTARRGSIGFRELLLLIWDKWANDRESLLNSAENIIKSLENKRAKTDLKESDMPDLAMSIFYRTYDVRFGGFGSAPKFPAAHNLIFLMTYYERRGDENALKMCEKTLMQMYRGGIFDHIGFGFSRYSTDAYFLAPHFEKMLYDNALLMQAYSMAYQITKNEIYLQIAEKIAHYVMREMRSENGAFYSAQDADSEGEEGKYYLFTPSEIKTLIGEKEREAFNCHYDITEQGNFNGKNIPNLLKTDSEFDKFDALMPEIYQYRRKRYGLRTDDKILCSWNSLMIAAFCSLYRVSREGKYLDVAKKAFDFIEENMYKDSELHVSWRGGKLSGKGYLDDYAAYIYALLALYQATFEQGFIERASKLADTVIREFGDNENGGFYLYGNTHETMVLRPKESYDGALPSGNSLMAYDLVRLSFLREDLDIESVLNKHMNFMRAEAQNYPAGYSMFLVALSDMYDAPETVTVVGNDAEIINTLPFAGSLSSMIRVIEEPSEKYRLINQKTTFYVCRENRCFPPSNEWNGIGQ